MKFRKADGSAIEIDDDAPLYVPDAESATTLLELLADDEQVRLVQWLQAAPEGYPRAVQAWPGWPAAFERRHALFNASWTSMGELIERLRSAGGAAAAGA